MCSWPTLCRAQPITTQPAPKTTDRSAANTLPVVGQPLAVAYRRLAAERIAILSPLSRQPSTRPWGLVLTYAKGRIDAYDPRSGKPLWRQSALSAARPKLLAVGREHAVFATPTRFFALTLAEGRQQWEIGRQASTDPMSDPESIESWPRIAVTADRFFAASSTLR